MNLLEKKGSLRYIFVGIAILAAGFLSALWVYAGN